MFFFYSHIKYICCTSSSSHYKLYIDNISTLLENKKKIFVRALETMLISPKQESFV
jgi:hypothetical protein